MNPRNYPGKHIGVRKVVNDDVEVVVGDVEHDSSLEMMYVEVDFVVVVEQRVTSYRSVGLPVRV